MFTGGVALVWSRLLAAVVVSMSGLLVVAPSASAGPAPASAERPRCHEFYEDTQSLGSVPLKLRNGKRIGRVRGWAGNEFYSSSGGAEGYVQSSCFDLHLRPGFRNRRARMVAKVSYDGDSQPALRSKLRRGLLRADGSSGSRAGEAIELTLKVWGKLHGRARLRATFPELPQR